MHFCVIQAKVRISFREKHPNCRDKEEPPISGIWTPNDRPEEQKLTGRRRDRHPTISAGLL